MKETKETKEMKETKKSQIIGKIYIEQNMLKINMQKIQKTLVK